MPRVLDRTLSSSRNLVSPLRAQMPPLCPLPPQAILLGQYLVQLQMGPLQCTGLNQAHPQTTAATAVGQEELDQWREALGTELHTSITGLAHEGMAQLYLGKKRSLHVVPQSESQVKVAAEMFIPHPERYHQVQSPSLPQQLQLPLQ